MTTSGYVGPAEQGKRSESDSQPRSLMNARQRRRFLRELLVERFGSIRTIWREQSYRNPNPEDEA